MPKTGPPKRTPRRPRTTCGWTGTDIGTAVKNGPERATTQAIDYTINPRMAESTADSNQKLIQDVLAARAHGLADADFVGALNRDYGGICFMMDYPATTRNTETTAIAGGRR